MPTWCRFLLRLALLACAATTAAPLAAQKRLQGTRAQSNIFEKTFGISGNVHAGMTYGFLGTLADDLNRDGSLGVVTPADIQLYNSEQPFEFSGIGAEFGGTVSLLGFRRFLLQGSLTYRDYTEGQTFRGVARLSNLSYGGSIGYTIINRDSWLLYPYAGYHVGTSTLDVDNLHIGDIQFGDNVIGKNGSGSWDAQTGTVEVGIGGKYSFGPDETRGVLVGAELGGYFNVGSKGWERADGTVVGDVANASLSGVYLRVTLGYGIFQVARAQGRRVRYEAATRNDPQPPAADEPDVPAEDDRPLVLPSNPDTNGAALKGLFNKEPDAGAPDVKPDTRSDRRRFARDRAERDRAAAREQTRKSRKTRKNAQDDAPATNDAPTTRPEPAKPTKVDQPEAKQPTTKAAKQPKRKPTKKKRDDSPDYDASEFEDDRR